MKKFLSIIFALVSVLVFTSATSITPVYAATDDHYEPFETVAVIEAPVPAPAPVIEDAEETEDMPASAPVQTLADLTDDTKVIRTYITHVEDPRVYAIEESHIQDTHSDNQYIYIPVPEDKVIVVFNMADGRYVASIVLADLSEEITGIYSDGLCWYASCVDASGNETIHEVSFNADDIG